MKKIIIIALLITFVLSLIITVNGNFRSTVFFDDVLEKTYEAFYVLVDADIVNDTEGVILPGHMFDRKITRAEVATVVSRFLGWKRTETSKLFDLRGLSDEERLAEFERIKIEFNLEYINILRESELLPGVFSIEIATLDDVVSVFADVEHTHWVLRPLSFAYEMGIITGDGDGNFRPNDNITEREAITMVVRALGYEENAQESGGFPDGYLQIAEELGLFEHTIMNIDIEREDLLYGNLYLLLYNAVQYREALEV